MTTPKHRTAPGTSYFVTTKCWQGRSVFQVPENAEILIKTLFRHREREAYLLHEFVVMPDHLHLLLTADTTASLERAVQLIKGGSSHEIHKERNVRMEIWQEGFYDWTIRDGDDWRTKAEYIRMNPVRAKLVSRPEEWPYSSAAGRFSLDSMPSKYSQMASGAKAQIAGNLTPGLKPRPPKESEKTVGGHLSAVQTPNAGPEGSIPRTEELKALATGAKAQIAGNLAPGLKPRPPKESEKTVGGHLSAVQTLNARTEGSIPRTKELKALASGAKAQIPGNLAPGLKPRPPMEAEKSGERPSSKEGPL